MSRDKETSKIESDGHVSPKRTRRGSSRGNSGSAGLRTPERKSDQPRQQQQPQQQTPKSDFKNFAESMGSPFGVGLFSPQSNTPFTPGSLQGGPHSSTAAPTSRDWSPFCHSANSFDFYSSSPSSGAPMNKIFNDMRGGRPSSSSADQSPAEYISSSAWGGHLAHEMLMDQDQDQTHPGGISSPLGLNFPPPMQHLYPHHQHTLGSSDVHENLTSRLSSDLFSANGVDDRKRKHMTSSPPPSRRKEALDAPPSPGFEAITAAAKELESQSNVGVGDKIGGKAPRRRGQKEKDKDKPMLAPPRTSQAQGPGLLKGVVGALHCSTTSAGEQVPTMRYAQHASTGKGNGSSQSKTAHKGLPLYLPQKSGEDGGDNVAKKSINAELQTYINSVDGSTGSGDSSGAGSNQMSSPEAMSVGGIKVPDISPAMKHVSVTCNCKKSKCLKLYCDCFRVQQYCSGCHCNNCSNLKEFESERQAAVASITERNPEAFKPRITQVDAQLLSGSGGSAGLRARMGQHLQGCHCKKSACLKKYCECFQAEVPCHERCRCLECKNTPADREAKLAAAGGTELVGGVVGISSTVASAANLKTYNDLKPPSNLLGNGGSSNGKVLQASHMDLTSALLSPASTSSRSVRTPSSGGGSSSADEDDLTPIYNKAQAEQAALEIVSAFLRGELTVPGVEYLSTKSSAMRNYSVTSSPHQRSANPSASAASSSLPLMEKLNEFEESRLRGQSGKEKLSM